jgi:hypothetical protein
MILNSPTISGSLTVTGNILASGSITLSGSVASASFAATASFVALAQSASNAVAAATASSADNLLVRNTLTAQTLVVQTVTSSVIYSSGSNVFGNNIANTQIMTGSVTVTGSLAVVTTGTEFQVTSAGVRIGNIITDTHPITGSVGISGSLTGVGGVTANNFIATSTGNANVFNAASATTGWMQVAMNNTNGSAILGIEGDTAGTTTNGSLAYATILRNYTNTALQIATNNIVRATITSDGSVGIGTTNTSAEGNLFLGAKTTLEGGQLILQRGTSQVSASHLDNYSNQFRIMSGTDTASSTVRVSVDMTNGATTFFGSVTSPSLYGNSYSQTSASGTTSFVNTGIFYNTSLTGFFNNGTYLLAVTGNPNGAGSSEYRGVYVGYIFVTTGYDFGISSVVQRISYTQLVTGDPLNIGALTISSVFWNGTTETTQQTNGTTNNQIRIKITGYNSSNIGAGQVVTLTKVI